MLTFEWMKSFLKYFLFFLLTTKSFFSFSQYQKHIDSLEKILKTAPADSLKITVLNNLASAYNKISAETSKKYALKALALSKKTKDEMGAAYSYNIIGTTETDLGNYNTAKQYYDSSFSIYTKLGNKKNIASVLHNLGNCTKLQANLNEAADYYFRALKIREEINDQKGIADSYNVIGNIYVAQEKYDKSIPNYRSSLNASQKINYRHGISVAYVNLGKSYRELKQIDSALYFMNNAYSIAIEEGENQAAGYTLINMATVYSDKKDFSSSLKNYKRALGILNELGDKYAAAYCVGGIGDVYFQQKNYKEALLYQDSTLKIAKELGAKDLEKEVYKAIVNTYDSLKDFKSAYEFHVKYSDIKDTILNEESSNQITEMQTKYETEKKEQQITLLNKDKELQDAQLNRQKIIIWSVAGGLLAVLILSIFIFRERKKSEKLLLNILPAETARELKANGKATAKHYESVTVMFTDFKGFTTIAEKLSAEELVNELDFLFRKFDEIISKYNIEKIKTIGDAYMCASGLPSANSNHAENIVKAGLEIQQWMIRQNSKWQLRIGIHSGAVTAGVVGDKKFAYDIWGDTVNTASRMESSGEAGKINISGATHQLIKEQFICEFRGKIPAKNKGQIDMYFVKSA